MNIKIKYLLVVIFILTYGLSAYAQDRYYKAGLNYFEKSRYRDAVNLFNSDKNANKNSDLLLKRIISNYELNNLEAAKKDVPTLLTFNKIPDELYLYIAKIFHAELNFEKAIEYYKEYLQRTPKKDPLRQMVISEIKRCATGLQLQYSEQNAFVENMGPSINSAFNETDPLQSPNNFYRYYFSSSRPDAKGGRRDEKGLKDDVYGQFYLDMYSATLFEGKWTSPEPLNDLLNTSKHERVLDFSADGNIVLFMKGGKPNQGTIHVDTFGVQKNEIYPPRFPSPVIGEKGDIYLQLFNDSTLVFSSQREGGYGGYDIYVSYKKKGKWSDPVNLGPEVNSAYDEISPFITADGLTLYFSSNGLNSIGGFDVFKSAFDISTGVWSHPKNLLIGINSASDDTHYKIASDGQYAYFQSTRKSGYGKGDLYFAYLKNQELGQLAYTPELPFIETLKSNKTNPAIGPRSSKPVDALAQRSTVTENKPAVTKEFFIENLYYGVDENLFTNKNNQILQTAIDILNIYPSVQIELSCHSVLESQLPYDLYFSMKRAEIIAGYFKEKGIAPYRIHLKGLGPNYPMVMSNYPNQESSLAKKLNRRIEIRFLNVEGLPLNIQYENPVVSENLKDFSYPNYIYKTKDLSYRIQIATTDQMYQNEVINFYPDPIIEKQEDKNTYLYTLGIYKTYFEAQTILKILRDDNFSNAVIIPFINGQRIKPSELADIAKQFPDLVNYLQYNGN